MRTRPVAWPAAVLCLLGAAQAQPESITPIAVTGEQIPGIEGGTYTNLSGQPIVLEDGTVVFRGVIQTPNTFSDGVVFAARDGVTVPLVGRGDEITGAEGLTFNSIGGALPLVAGQNGSIVGRAAVSDGSTLRDAFVSIGTGGTGILASVGDEAPGTGGATFLALDTQVSVGAPGQTVFRGTLTGDGVNIFFSSALFSATEGGTVLVARALDDAPGLPGRRISQITSYDANSSGQIAYFANVGSTSRPDNVLYLTDGEETSILFRDGTSLPDGSGPLSIGGSDLALRDDGSLVAVGSFAVQPPQGLRYNQGLLVLDDDGIETLVRSGDAAPGAEGLVFERFTEVSANEVGEIAFIAQLAGGEENRPQDLGLFARSVDGDLISIVREGDLFTVGGEEKTILSLVISSDSLNDLGLLAFTLRFEDNTSGVFLADLFGDGMVSAVPLPSAFAFFAIGAAGLGAARRRRR